MAKELTAAGRLLFDDGDTRVEFNKGVLTIDSTGKQVVHHIQSIGTSEEALDVGDITTLGWIIFFNRDKTNYVEIRPGSGLADLLRIEKREVSGPMRLAQDATLYAIANTAACELEYLLIED
jgi:hypothetical protein